MPSKILFYFVSWSLCGKKDFMGKVIGKIIRNGKGRWMGKLNFQILLASAWAVRHY
jgi:hypothetical protein